MDDAAPTDLHGMIRPLIEEGFPFVERMGLRLDEVRPGYCRLTAPIEGNGNHIGTMYAGALFTLAEIPGGVIFLATFDAARYYPIVKGVDIRFLRFARTDISVEVSIAPAEVQRIQAVADEHGKADYSWTCDLVDADAQVVARSTNDYQLRTHGT
jgi:acyl-coenzyme A thioesterase PaaI-like protein